MSLLENAYEDFDVMDPVSVDDGYGGTTQTWTEGITIKGAMTKNTSAQAQIAQAMKATGAYTLIVKKDTVLNFHNVLKRKSDGKVFRLVNDSDDRKTPTGAALNMRLYNCEEYVLP